MKKALIVGVSGIGGSAAAEHLMAHGWDVYGLARHATDQPGVTPVTADLQDVGSLKAALSSIHPEAVYITTWMRRPTEAENIQVNSAILRNLFSTLNMDSLRHVALVTGMKHYLGPFENYGKGTPPPTPLREDQGRLDLENFYYAQEDEVFAAARQYGFNWSIHRAHTIIGKAVGNAMNMGTTLAVYATICKETGKPFQFPGVQTQWDSLTDITDSRILAKHLFWATITPAAQNEDFNIVNGDIWMWQQIADWFGIEAVPFDGTVRTLESQMANDAETWKQIVERHKLLEPDITRLISPWHTDADLGRPIEVVTDMSKSRKLGFTEYQASNDSFFDLFRALRHDRLIP